MRTGGLHYENWGFTLRELGVYTVKTGGLHCENWGLHVRTGGLTLTELFTLWERDNLSIGLDVYNCKPSISRAHTITHPIRSTSRLYALA